MAVIEANYSGVSNKCKLCRVTITGNRRGWEIDHTEEMEQSYRKNTKLERKSCEGNHHFFHVFNIVREMSSLGVDCK